MHLHDERKGIITGVDMSPNHFNSQFSPRKHIILLFVLSSKVWNRIVLMKESCPSSPKTRVVRVKSQSIVPTIICVSLDLTMVVLE
jgi:hypothetical protein